MSRSTLLVLVLAAAGCTRNQDAPGTALQVVFVADAKWKQDEGKKEMESALARFPQIDLVYAHNDPMAIGAYLAAKAKGRDREMKFIGIDALPGLDGGRQAVADGKLDATFVYPTGGRQAVELAARILSGERVPRKVVLPTEKITRENALR